MLTFSISNTSKRFLCNVFGFTIFHLSPASFTEDFVFVSFQQKNEIKKGNTPMVFKYLLFRSRLDLFDVKYFQKKFHRS